MFSQSQINLLSKLNEVTHEKSLEKRKILGKLDKISKKS